MSPGSRGAGLTSQPRRQVGTYFNRGGGRAWVLQVLTEYPAKAAGGFNSKVGRIGKDRLPSVLTANHGYCGQANLVVLFRHLKQPGH